MRRSGERQLVLRRKVRDAEGDLVLPYGAYVPSDKLQASKLDQWALDNDRRAVRRRVLTLPLLENASVKWAAHMLAALAFQDAVEERWEARR